MNAERSISEYKKLLKASDIKVGELLAMIKEMQAEIQILKEKIKSMHVAGSARNVATSRSQQPSPAPQEETDDDSDDDDDEGISWIPKNDEDLTMDSEEMERLKEKVSSLEALLLSQKSLQEEETRKKIEDEKRLRVLAEQESLNQFTKGWQVGQRAVSEAYGNGVKDDREC